MEIAWEQADLQRCRLDLCGSCSCDLSIGTVRAASDVDLERPSTLISAGPYAISRNPMYVGWTLLYLGSALVTRSAWMIASVPVVAGVTHREVLREEHTLEGAFEEEYARYKRLVRRYL
jgi:protein-S-isoprenylcysteine O-methyltransferase Ste14